jgi:RNA ligase (TIGR02306 family)
MSTFTVKVVKVMVGPHNNSDNLEIGNIAGYQTVLKKGQFVTGDLAAYIPEQSVIPANIITELGLDGYLAGAEKNRVKAIKLRGVLSQGLLYPARPHWNEGDDVTEELGIVKFESPIPRVLAGEVWCAGYDRTLKYDIENIKNYPHVIQVNEPVIMTEKIHGTFSIFGILPPTLAHHENGDYIVSSKGLSAKGLALKHNEKNDANLYMRAARHFKMDERIRNVFAQEVMTMPVYILGEIMGQGVQDLSYGASINQDTNIGYRVFDIYLGFPGLGRYLNDDELDKACLALNLPRVPVLYRGPFTYESLNTYTNGKETISGKNLHIREGVVVRPIYERIDLEVGRVQLKSISADYLLRKGDTTEFT